MRIPTHDYTPQEADGFEKTENFSRGEDSALSRGPASPLCDLSQAILRYGGIRGAGGRYVAFLALAGRLSRARRRSRSIWARRPRLLATLWKRNRLWENELQPRWCLTLVRLGEVKRESAESGGTAVNAEAWQRESSSFHRSCVQSTRWDVAGDVACALCSAYYRPALTDRNRRPTPLSPRKTPSFLIQRDLPCVHERSSLWRLASPRM